MSLKGAYVDKILPVMQSQIEIHRLVSRCCVIRMVFILHAFVTKQAHLSH